MALIFMDLLGESFVTGFIFLSFRFFVKVYNEEGRVGWPMSWRFTTIYRVYHIELVQSNVCPAKKRTKPSSILLLRLVRFSAEQTLYTYKTIEARVNTVAIPTNGKSCSLYRELLKPLWVIYQQMVIYQ